MHHSFIPRGITKPSAAKKWLPKTKKKTLKGCGIWPQVSKRQASRTNQMSNDHGPLTASMESKKHRTFKICGALFSFVVIDQ